MRKTALLILPTLDEVKKLAAAVGLPEREAIKFFNFYESKGWMVGKNRMVGFRSAIENWKLNWEEKGCPGLPPVNGGKGPLTPGQMMIYQKEFERIMERLRSLRASYSDHQSWTKQDKAEFNRLLDRRDELKKILGVVI